MKISATLAAIALLLGGCAADGVHAGRVIPPGAGFVSLGSSFAAGPGIGPIRPGTPERCSRATNNYASLLAARLDLALTDASCGGATTEHVLGSWNELPPQLDAVTRDTRLVTITIGGNDLGYVAWLFAGSCRLGARIFPGPCREAKEPQEADYQKLESQLRLIAAEVHRRAPGARLVFVQYVSLISPEPCAQETISPADAEVARRIAKRLAQVTQAAASAGKAELLSADIASSSHTPCSASPWSLGMSADYKREQGAAWHPNAAGHAAIADMLFRLLAEPAD